jgi:enoyl-CoA hydratase/carnithine racemase
MNDTGESENIEWRLADGILRVTLNRPHRLNALSRRLQDELAAFWREARLRRDIRCVILTGNGRAFSVGADVDDLQNAVRPDTSDGIAPLNFCPSRHVDVPVIVAINGMCLGGALNFLADADIAIAADTAWFSDPHVTMGQVSGPEVLQLAAKASFKSVAQLALSGAPYRISAQRALELQLISEVVPADELSRRADEIATMIAAQSPTAIRATLSILRRRVREPIAAELQSAWDLVVAQWQHPDAKEGPAAFGEKRPARWEPVQVEPSQSAG